VLLFEVIKTISKIARNCFQKPDYMAHHMLEELVDKCRLILISGSFY